MENRFGEQAAQLPAITININGCPNACARTQIADIGLKEMIVTNDAGEQVEGFQVHLGGGLGLDAGFGRKVRGHKITGEDVPDYIERVVKSFDAQRHGGQVRPVGGPRRRRSVALMSENRAPAQYCPYCGETGLWPGESGHAGPGAAGIACGCSRSSSSG